jgi:REP element-mobilizing transposase RayT
MYHIVCPTKYRRVVIDEKVDETLKQICLEIEIRYEITFLEIGTDKDHVHFLVQSIPKYSPSQLVRVIKSITGREIFAKCPEVKEKLWGRQFWTDGYFVGTVGKNVSEEAISKYVNSQGKTEEYNQLHLNMD